MNVGQLEKICASIDDKTMDVFIKQINTDYPNSACEIVVVKKIRFKGEGIPKNEEPIIKCLVITDDI